MSPAKEIQKTYTMKKAHIVVLAAASTIASASYAQAQVVYANAASPGDAYTNPGGSNQGQAVGSSGWYYNNTRNSGVVGIDTALPRSGNGSAHFGSPSGASKADIELLPGGFNLGGNYFSTGVLGNLSDLVGLSYDWYRSSSSTADPGLHPVIRLLIDLDGNLQTTGDRGGLVYERAYNSPSTVPTDTWVSENIFANNAGAGADLWSFGLGKSFAADGYDVNLSEWQLGVDNLNPTLGSSLAKVIGISLGVGSGWNGTFDGAVDNVSFQFRGADATVVNFEVEMAAVPEVSTVVSAIPFGIGAIFAVYRRRKSSQA